MPTTAIGKVLSANDLGQTGAHQVGIYVPRDPLILDFFPHLNPADLNPQVEIDFEHDATGTVYRFKFVYYNGRLHDSGTRDEYRLTRMTDFFRQVSLGPGDTLVLYRNGDRFYVSDAIPPYGITPVGENWAVVVP